MHQSRKPAGKTPREAGSDADACQTLAPLATSSPVANTEQPPAGPPRGDGCSGGRAFSVAALFVETNGVYFGLPNVDPWDEKRDARKYTGPWPVVAHPPCQLWTNLAHVNFKRYGGEHNRPGNDGGMFASALRAVEKFGGVLEHPAGSHAWPMWGLTRPERGRWVKDTTRPGFVCEVAQSAYGHKARKLTWLYYVGPKPPDLDWSRPEGTHQCGWFDRIKPTLGKKEASRTPLRFRDLLLNLARTAAGGTQ